MLSVPDPHPNDPEGVVSALETAAIFGTQGDVKEAVRWVRKAAEIAGDEGNDERALTLARAIADLNISASQPPQPAAQSQTPAAAPQSAQPAPSAQPAQAAAPPVQAAPPITAATPAAAAPPPPPLPVSAAAPALGAGATAYDPDGDAETRVVESAAVLAEFQKQQSNGNGAGHAAAVLPPPSISAVATPVATPAEMIAAVAAFNDEPPPPPPPPVPSAAAADTAPDFAKEEESTPPSRSGIGSMAELLARKEAEVSSARAAADAMDQPADAHADAGWDDPPPPPPPPAQASVPPVERRTAHPAAERIQTPLIPSQPYLERPPVNAPVHQAVRGSIVATAEPGVFVLRVLTAEQAPAPTGHEVLVVVTDPSSSPFK